MVILGTSGLMLFSWLNQNFETVSRLSDAENRARLRLEAQSLLSTVNPGTEPVGEKDLLDLRLRWHAELVEPMRDEYDMGGYVVPRWRLGLYRVRFQAEHLKSGVRVSWEQLVAGWRLRSGNEVAGGLSGLQP